MAPPMTPPITAPTVPFNSRSSEELAPISPPITAPVAAPVWVRGPMSPGCTQPVRIRVETVPRIRGSFMRI